MKKKRMPSAAIIYLIFLFLFAFCSVKVQATSAANDETTRAQAYYHYVMGAMKENSRDYSTAIDEYKQALKFDPEASEILSHLANLYVQTNRMDEAISDAHKAIERNPDNKEVHRMLGQIYMEKLYLNDSNPSDLQQAIKEFQEVHRIDPTDDYAQLSLGQLYLQNNQPQNS